MLSKARLLIVDDFAGMRRMVSAIALELGCLNIHEAESAAAAQRALCSMQFDLVLADLLMPAMSGLELLLWMRADSRLQSVPVLLMVTYLTASFRKEALEVGASGCIVKPFTVSTLEYRLHRIMNLQYPRPR